MSSIRSNNIVSFASKASGSEFDLPLSSRFPKENFMEDRKAKSGFKSLVKLVKKAASGRNKKADLGVITVKTVSYTRSSMSSNTAASSSMNDSSASTLAGSSFSTSTDNKAVFDDEWDASIDRNDAFLAQRYAPRPPGSPRKTVSVLAAPTQVPSIVEIPVRSGRLSGYVSPTYPASVSGSAPSSPCSFVSSTGAASYFGSPVMAPSSPSPSVVEIPVRSGRLSGYVSPTYPATPSSPSTPTPVVEIPVRSGRLSGYVSPTYPASPSAPAPETPSKVEIPVRSGRLSGYVSPTYPASQASTPSPGCSIGSNTGARISYFDIPVVASSCPAVTPGSPSSAVVASSGRLSGYVSPMYPQLQEDIKMPAPTPVSIPHRREQLSFLRKHQEFKASSIIKPWAIDVRLDAVYPNVQVYAPVYPHNLNCIYPSMESAEPAPSKKSELPTLAEFLFTDDWEVFPMALVIAQRMNEFFRSLTLGAVPDNAKQLYIVDEIAAALRVEGAGKFRPKGTTRPSQREFEEMVVSFLGMAALGAVALCCVLATA